MKIEGMDKLLKQLSEIGKEGEIRIAQTTEGTAAQIEADAKQLAPVDTGKLQQGIKKFEINKLSWAVFANAHNVAPYSAYMEFGTGGLVEIPDELKDQALQFKGKGIREVNLRPQPFLYPAFVKGRKQYIKDLKEDLKDLTK